jgi:hypothetical protein
MGFLAVGSLNAQKFAAEAKKGGGSPSRQGEAPVSALLPTEAL